MGIEKKLALVVEGGAMRGIFSSGVLDAFIEAEYYPFDLCIGVSAGATVLGSYLAKMEKRNYIIYTKYSRDRHFINPLNFLRGGHYIDLDWLWDICIQDIRLDLDTLMKNHGEYLVGVTGALDGQIEYIKPVKDNLEELVKASSAVPVMYRNPVRINGKFYWDGGVADPIPVREAINRSATKIVVLRSRKKDFIMKERNFNLTNIFLKQYPEVVRAINDRPKVYNDTIDLIRSGVPGVEIVEVCPAESFKTSRLTTDLAVLERDYQMGFKEGRRLIKWLQDEKHAISSKSTDCME
jgi:predicted patatin/cPLA2 family phospholipase